MPRDKILRQLDEYQYGVEIAIKQAKKLGAHEVEVSVAETAGLSVSVRQQEIDTLEYHQDKSLSVTVYTNQSKGSASTTDFSEKAIKAAAKAATEIAQFTSKDEYAGLPHAENIAWDYPSLDLYHPWKISTDDAVVLATECEAAALKQDKRISNSEGATLSTHNALRLYGNSQGFIGAYPSSSHSLGCSVIAGDADVMQRDRWYDISRHPEFLDSAKSIGKQAAKRALARLNAQQITTGKYPVLFSSEMAAGLFGHFVSAISGGALYRKSSFLLDALGKKIFPEWIHIYEQPHIIGAVGSAPFDSEGVKNTSHNIVSDGLLETYILGSYAARKLGLKTTGNAGGVRNLCIEPGKHNFKTMLKQMDKGLLVTELMGQGVNTVTGDYSRGATGFWVENGKIQYPVQEITIAGNLKDMFQQISAVGSDVDLRRNTRTGSVLIAEMTIAGK